MKRVRLRTRVYAVGDEVLVFRRYDTGALVDEDLRMGKVIGVTSTELYISSPEYTPPGVPPGEWRPQHWMHFKNDVTADDHGIARYHTSKVVQVCFQHLDDALPT